MTSPTPRRHTTRRHPEAPSVRPKAARRRQRGSITVLLVLAVFLLFLMLAGIAQLGMIFLIKAKLQRVADAAALAGVRMCAASDPAPAAERARLMARINSLDLVDLAAGEEVTITVPDPNCDTLDNQFHFRVEASLNVELLFTRFWEAIVEKITVECAAEAARGSVDLMLVFDTSGFVKMPPPGWAEPSGNPTPPGDPLLELTNSAVGLVDRLVTGRYVQEVGAVRYDTFAYEILPLTPVAGGGAGAIRESIRALPGLVQSNPNKRPFVFNYSPTAGSPAPSWRFRDNLHWGPSPEPGGEATWFGWGFDFPNLATATHVANGAYHPPDQDSSVKAMIFFVSSIPMQPGDAAIPCGIICPRGRNPQTGVARNAKCRDAVFTPPPVYAATTKTCNTECLCGGGPLEYADIYEALRRFNTFLDYYNTVFYYIVFYPGNGLVADCISIVPPPPGAPNNCAFFDFNDPGYVWGDNVFWFDQNDIITQYDAVMVPELDRMVSDGIIRGHYRAYNPADLEAMQEDLIRVIHSDLVR